MARDEFGRWVPGTSGNYGRRGMPRAINLAALVRERVKPEELIDQLMTIAMTAPDLTTRIRAAKELFDRGWGKAAITAHLSVSERNPVHDQLAQIDNAALIDAEYHITELLRIRCLPVPDEHGDVIDVPSEE